MKDPISEFWPPRNSMLYSIYLKKQKKTKKSAPLSQQILVTMQNNDFHPGDLLLTFWEDLEVCTPTNANI